MKHFTAALFLATALTAKGQPPNNAIFKGGNADGCDRNAFAQTANNIYTGGTGDGWHVGAFQQSAANIYKGGEGDGWAKASFQQTVVNIYAGGEGDGWSFNGFLQPGNAIFGGGEGDGWNYANFLQAGNGIFAGGGGDGWASTYRPLGVLPVTFIDFTAQKQATAALLKWQTVNEVASASFDVERSADALHFTRIGNVAAAGNSTTVRSYSFTDAQPSAGYNYYRLKQLDRNGTFVYTPVRMVLFDAATLQTVRAYPIPATSLLTMEIPAALRSEEVVVNLSNALGVMVQHARLARNRTDDRRVLNLASLPAGVYTLQVVSKSFTGSISIVKQ